jgi:hypothetical protein
MPPGTPLSQYLRARRALTRPEDDRHPSDQVLDALARAAADLAHHLR